MTAPRLGALLGHLPEGLNEIYTHPATVDAFSGHAPGYRHTQELATLTDPEAIRTCTHKSVAEMLMWVCRLASAFSGKAQILATFLGKDQQTLL
jgi:hypothetical protein